MPCEHATARPFRPLVCGTFTPLRPSVISPIPPAGATPPDRSARRRLHQGLARLGFAVALLAIGFLALTGAPPPALDTGHDKHNHVLAFGSLWLLARSGWPQGAVGAWALALLAYGAGIEVAQSFTPTRHAEALDVLADGIGLLAGAALRAAGLGLRRFGKP